MPHTILIVDDEIRLLDVLSGALEALGYASVAAANGAEALNILEREQVDLVLTDLRMPVMGGRELLAEIRSKHPAMPVVIMTAFSSVRDAVQAIKDGAFDYIDKPIEQDDLSTTLANALRLRDALRDNEHLRQELAGRYKFDSLVGNSGSFRAVIRSVGEVCEQRTTVLLTGESGTGKEVVARAIHFNSPRHRKPFVAVNCAAIPENLLESEFFGHVKGSFTGALTNRTGRFGQAEGGTLFLDEVGDMPLHLQAKILRVLQERQYEPVGGSSQRSADVRIIAATNRDLLAMAGEGRFREDLYYRLAVFPIALPALRERPEDIPLLLDLFVNQLSSSLGKRGIQFSAEAARLLSAYRWPGNVRELQNCVERLLIQSKGRTIEARDLPAYLTERPAAEPGAGFPILLDEEAAVFERRYILAALKQANGVQVRAAELLGINERSLWHRLKKYGIAISKAAAAQN
ncbi:sigma-54-dependent transcriptional regulator [Zavarzinia compransoris]|uniref:Sigma-54-dependent Fis family transcriptional regulator n=1 Tax=Zavarzinia compransoris TaxID=1264899 RepID=A0A317E9Y3_9PROT|nr:sigma-54 dependent transcriptional regulator [Zavarzinia compransoris]PWR23056.1 sigma-54-dependent Fis family transcriptional regulator [Zavarzinia compransoris]TDP46399.1 DNA-binding NtrC family response regulator [Zavarzinia compransoris]